MQLLDEVVLTRDVPADGLRRGDLGTVVHLYPAGGVEVEFFTASGKTRAVVTLETADVREATDYDLVSVRSTRPADRCLTQIVSHRLRRCDSTRFDRPVVHLGRIRS
jgi:hypothetical protein